MYRIKFKFKDRYTHGEWREQFCIMESLEKAIKWYGLNDGDVEFQIISVEEV